LAYETDKGNCATTEKKQYCNNNTDKTKGPTAVSYEVAKQLRLAAYCRTR